jgi:hypothetical protein
MVTGKFGYFERVFEIGQIYLPNMRMTGFPKQKLRL